MAVEVIDETGRCLHVRELSAVLEALLDEMGHEGDEATLVIVDDPTIARLNQRDRGVDGPTDVLSYPLHEPTDVGHPRTPHLGDMIVSLDTATEQARASGHTLPIELVTLAAHGLMHLLGHDHQTEEEWGPFRAAQARAAAILGAQAEE